MSYENNKLKAVLSTLTAFSLVLGLSGCGKKAEEPTEPAPVEEEVVMSAAPADNVEPVIVADDLTAVDEQAEVIEDVDASTVDGETLVTDDGISEMNNLDTEDNVETEDTQAEQSSE